MFYRIFLFVALFVPSRVLPKDAGSIAFAARDAALLEAPLYEDTESATGEEKTGLLIAGIVSEETGGNGTGGDKGASCGGTQLK